MIDFNGFSKSNYQQAVKQRKDELEIVGIDKLKDSFILMTMERRLQPETKRLRAETVVSNKISLIPWREIHALSRK